MNQIYNLTLLRHERIKKFMNGKYFALWECQFDRAVKEVEEFGDFVRNFNMLPPPLRIRDALTGGRTEPIYTLHDCTSNAQDKIRYLDYCVSNLC